MDLPSTLELVGRLVLAAVLGGLIGFERELRDHPAGLRTHITVAVGSALFVIAGAYGWGDFLTSERTNVVVGVDRVASNVVTGIGFLGGGAILKYGANIKGLTTAASLWVTAAVGLGAGLGSYAIIVAATIVTLLSLVAMRLPERWIQNKLSLDRETIVLYLERGSSASPTIAALTEVDDLAIRQITVREDDPDVIIEAMVVGTRRGAHLAERVAHLAERPEVRSIEVA